MGDDDANAIMDEMRAQGQKYIDSAGSPESREFIFYYSNDTVSIAFIGCHGDGISLHI